MICRAPDCRRDALADWSFCEPHRLEILRPPQRPRDRRACPVCGSLVHVLCNRDIPELEMRLLYGDR